MRIRLLGSRKFITLPPGTLYVEYWMKSTQECNKLINEFKSNPGKFLDTSRLMIYYDNSASLVLEGAKDDDEICLTDVNVVGDAMPDYTLRVVFDEDAIGDTVMIFGSCGNEMVEWTRDELFTLVNDLKNDADVTEAQVEFNAWAIEKLNDLGNEGNTLIDVDLEAII